MVKSVLGVNHQGLRDWVIQRVSAILITFYSLGLMAYLLCHPDLSYGEWHNLFSLAWMKIATILFVSAVLCHAWIGVWTIFTDYVKVFVISCILHTLVLIALAACFIWAVIILWGV